MNRLTAIDPTPIPASPEFEALARGAQFRDRIVLRVNAPPEAIVRASREVTWSEMKLARLLGEIRCLPARLAGHQPAGDFQKPFLSILSEGGTLILYDDGRREIITGSEGQLHRIVDQAPVRFEDRDAFQRFNHPAHEKLFMSLRIEPTDVPGEHWLVLEHATRALSAEAERKFRRYWLIIKPGGAFVTRQLLKAIRNRAQRVAVSPSTGTERELLVRSVRATPAEASRALPGDDLIPSPKGSLTHAVTIRRLRRHVWPWLAQMGAGSRAGWYSYDFVDNGRQPSARHIIPDLQHLSVGMILPALPGETEGFTLLGFEPERFLVIGWRSRDGGGPLMTWSFILEDAEHHSTRLIVRARAGPGYEFHRLPWTVTKHIVAIIHFVMQRKQLLGIAGRAESSPTGDVDTATPASTRKQAVA